MSEAVPAPSSRPPQWKPIEAIDRRVVGVLVEKAKTTPEQYPLTLNSLVTGANQKNNRDPQMQVEPEDVEEALDRLRAAGAVVEVQGSGRALKYRHMMYDWLGVNKVELGVMTELLLRGAQTEGELRGRAARMDPIPDLAALRPILESLAAKGLIISLTPEGRGHVLTHALYLPREMEALWVKFRDGAAPHPAPGVPPAAAPTSAPASTAASAPTSAPSTPMARSSSAVQSAAPPDQRLGREVERLRAEVSQLRQEFDELAHRCRRTEDDLRQMRDSLGG